VALDEPAPKRVFDLIEDLRSGYSADVFPYARDKRLRGYAARMEKAIKAGHLSNGRTLYNAISDAMKRNDITRRDARRLWEVWRIKQFLNKRRK